jgi:asparagine synthase (glutamine-hydrolysing)
MLAGVELRSPFLEPHIVDFAFNKVPQALRFKNSEQKILLRLLGSKLVPGWKPSRKKYGFVLPLRDWIRGNLGKRFKDILTDPGQTLFNKRYIEKLFTLHRYGANNANRIFCLVMFELWRRHYNPEMPPSLT